MRSRPRGLFGGVFAGAADAGDAAWLQAMLDAEAGLARALERAGLAPAGAGAGGHRGGAGGQLSTGEIGELAALTGNPVPALARALARRVPAGRGRRRAPRRHQPGHRGHGRHAAGQAGHRRDPGRLGPGRGRRGRAGRRAPGHDHDRPDAAPAGRPGHLRPGRGGLADRVDEARRGWPGRARRLAVQFGGAAGTLASLGDAGPRVAALLAEELGLAVPVLPWHTDRLRIIDLAAALARVAAALGKIARDVTLLAQTEVGEVREGSGPPAAPSASRPTRPASPACPARPGCPAARVPRLPGCGQRSSPRRGGSSAMPHKHNPVAAIAILGCTKQAPGLLATLAACAEQELQRAAGAWHAEWEPLTALLRLTGSAGQLGRRAADRPGRGHLADGRQPGRDQGPAAGRARHLPAGRRARRRPGARPGGRGGRAGGRAPACRCATCCWPCRSSRNGWPRRASPRSRSSPPWSRPGTSAPPDAFVAAALQAHAAAEVQLNQEDGHG